MWTYKNISRLTAISCLLIPVVIAMGAFTRLVDAGLGCPDWPSCYGHLLLWPQQEQDIAVANQLYTTPVDIDKTWPEVIHRYIAGVLSLLIVAIVVGLYKIRHRHSVPLKHGTFLLALLLAQVAFGAYTVTLKLWPQVVSIHLLTGFTLFVTTVLLWVRLKNFRWHLAHYQRMLLAKTSWWLWAALVVLFTQIFLGSWVSANYAALACSDFPTCQGYVFPPISIKAFDLLQIIGPNYLGGVLDNSERLAIHFIHRLGALITLIVVGIACIKLRRVAYKNFMRLANISLLLLGVQIFLGVSNVIFSVPIVIAVLHNLTAALLLAVLTVTKYQQIKHSD